MVIHQGANEPLNTFFTVCSVAVESGNRGLTREIFKTKTFITEALKSGGIVNATGLR